MAIKIRVSDSDNKRKTLQFDTVYEALRGAEKEFEYEGMEYDAFDPLWYEVNGKKYEASSWEELVGEFSCAEAIIGMDAGSFADLDDFFRIAKEVIEKYGYEHTDYDNVEDYIKEFNS